MDFTGFPDLVGRRLGKRYTLTELISGADQGEKNGIFVADDSDLKRVVALKILNPTLGQDRIDQFIKESQTLAQLGKYAHVTEIYDRNNLDGFNVMSMQFIRGQDLKSRFGQGERFSDIRIAEIMLHTARAIEYVHGEGFSHGDIKASNVALRDDSEMPCVLDFGGRLYTEGFSNDVIALGALGKELLNHRENPEKPPSKRLEKIFETATTPWGYDPSGLRQALERFHYWKSEAKLFGIGTKLTRRQAMIGTATTVASLAVLGGAYLAAEEYIEYRNSVGFTLGEIRDTDPKDYEALRGLYDELKFRLCDQKVRRWPDQVEEGSPFGTSADGEWVTHKLEEGVFWSDGYFRGHLLEAAKATGDDRLKAKALESVDEIKLVDLHPSQAIADVRFLHSHAKAYDLFGDPRHRDTALEALDLFAERFNEDVGLVSLFESRGLNSEAGLMSSVVEFNLWGSRVTENPGYFEIARRHVYTAIEANIRENGSVRKTAILHPSTLEIIGEQNSKGISGKSTLARSQAQMLYGLTEFLKYERDLAVLGAAERVAGFLIDNLPEDYVPYFDLDAPEGSKRDSSAACIALHGLSNLYEATQKQIYLDTYMAMKRSLVLNYLSPDLEGHEGIIRQGCENWKGNQLTNNSLIHGDYYFLTD